MRASWRAVLYTVVPKGVRIRGEPRGRPARQEPRPRLVRCWSCTWCASRPASAFPCLEETSRPSPPPIPATRLLQARRGAGVDRTRTRGSWSSWRSSRACGGAEGDAQVGRPGPCEPLASARSLLRRRLRLLQQARDSTRSARVRTSYSRGMNFERRTDLRFSKPAMLDVNGRLGQIARPSHPCSSAGSLGDMPVGQDVAQGQQLVDDRVDALLDRELARVERDLGVQRAARRGRRRR